MNNETNIILPVTFTAYRWVDLLSVFPEAFAEHANVYLSESGDISYGNNDTTLIRGTTAERILYDAWESWDYRGTDLVHQAPRRSFFALLPSLINALVAVDG